MILGSIFNLDRFHFVNVNCNHFVYRSIADVVIDLQNALQPDQQPESIDRGKVLSKP
jgi:hypothetical protein